jgi:hypothetical protein
MSKFRMLMVLCVLALSIYSFSAAANGSGPKPKAGFIYKVKVDVVEHLMERALVKFGNNSVYYSPRRREVVFMDQVDNNWLSQNNLNNKHNGQSFEILDAAQTNSLLEGLCRQIELNTDNEIVNFQKPSKTAKTLSMMGNMGANAIGKNKLSFDFPNKKLRRVKVKADEYYEINVDFIFGGEKDSYTVMNKQKGEPHIKFRAKVSIVASDKKGNLLWEKENETIDFASAFNEEDIMESEKGEFFKVRRAPRRFHSYNQQAIGDYLSLSKIELERCTIIALAAAFGDN